MPTRTTIMQAVRQANLPDTEHDILKALLRHASRETCEIPTRAQPANHGDHRFFGKPRRTVQRALLHLRRHGWVNWAPRSQGDRGRPANHYVISVGAPCQCPGRRRVPKVVIKRHPRAPIHRADVRTALYRMYAADGHLLYVGISKTFGRRWSRHAQTKSWYGEVKRQTVEWFPSEPEARKTEEIAIKTEHPEYNIQHTAGGSEGGEVVKSPETDNLCTACGTPMDPVLPAAGYRTHPGCEPYEGPQTTFDEFAIALVAAFPRDEPGEPGKAA